jgi:hypothetical protein
MLNINSSAYLRIAFDVPDTTAVDVMRLRVRYDDGFAAFLNSQSVASGGAPAALAWNSRATRGHSQQNWEEFDISVHAGALRNGKNVLAVQALNGTAANSDLFFLPEVETVNVGSVRPDVFLYFERSTPGSPNAAGIPEAAPRPQISLAGGTYVDTQTVEITTSLAGGVIRYTLDGTIPHAGSAAYAGPIQVTGPTRLAARVFKDGLLPGAPERRTFVIVAPGLVNFSSNIPLVLCVTFGRAMGTNCGGGPYTPGHFSIISPGPDGRANLVEEPHLTHLAAFRRRGSSTCGNAKFAFNVEMQDADGEDENVELLDFPVESDYIMYAPNNFDRALIRNPIAYWMSREVGQWAARTRNVECFFHTGTGPVTNTSYVGVYNLMEKNKRHPLKVDIQQITSRDIEGSAVTGGYLLRRDRVGPDEIAISGGGYSSLVFVYPKLPVTAQRTYMTSFLNQAIASLSPSIGKQEDNPLIDFTAFLDHHIINWYTKNVDAFRLSGYFYKDRDGPLAMGPVWDFDRTMGCSDDDRARDPQGWDNLLSSGDGGTRYFQAGGLGSWYSILFQNNPPITDTPWNQAYRARWRELRKGPLRTDRILAQLDFYAAELQEASVRDTAKWPGLRGRFGGFQGEINHLKNWLATRADWIDAQFIEKPRFSHPGGIVERGLQVQILMTAQAAIHYTLDGSDPRGPNAQPSASAILYNGPLTMDRNTRVFARALYPDGLWSGESKANYVVDVPRLMITEIMYNPLPPTPEEDPAGEFRTASRMEFVEIANVGTEAIPLQGMSLSKAVNYAFTQSAGSLEPGEVLVVPSNVRALAARYGEGIRVAGPFTGTLSDTGEAIALTGSYGETIFDFSYSSQWHPTTAGQGHSLVNADPQASAGTLGTPARWQPSAEVHGNPGRLDSGPLAGRHVPGDATGDARLNVSDAVATLRLLVGGATDGPCGDGGLETAGNRAILDWDGNGEVNVTDAVASLRYLFLEGDPHAAGTACVAVEGCVEACGG